MDIPVKLLQQGNYSSLDGWISKSQEDTHREVWDMIRRWSSSPEGQAIKPYTYISWIVERILERQ